MDLELEKKIAQAAKILEKSAKGTEEPKDIVALIKSWGPEKAKAAIRDLSEDELKALDESLSKAVSLDRAAAKKPKKIKQNASEEVEATQESSRGEDEEIVPKQAEAAQVRHQGGSGDDGAWQGQVIKAKDMPTMLDESEEAGKKAKKKPKDNLHPGDAKDGLKGSDAEEPRAEGAKMQKGTKGDMPAMMDEEDEAGKDSKEEGKPMSGKGGAKAKNPSKGKRPMSIAYSEEKSGQGDKPLAGKPQKEAKPQPKAEGAKMQKSAEEFKLDQLIARMKERKIEKSKAVEVLTKSGTFKEEEILAEWDKKLEKSIQWSKFDPNHVLIASTRRGQNATYRTEDYIVKSIEAQQENEKLAKSDGYRWRIEPKQEEKLEKSKKSIDINDLIEKGVDMSPEQIKKSAELVIMDHNKRKFAPGSFTEGSVAWALGMDKEKAEKALGGPLNASKRKPVKKD